MKKIISTILVLTMVLSLVCINVNAAHWAQQALDFVTEKGYWIAPDPIEPDRAATRAETASLFARILVSKIPAYNGAYSDVPADSIYGGDITAASLMGLMVGYEDKFRPEETLTREELACILDRASKMVSDEFVDTTYNMSYLKDRNEVSDWALQSVMNASAYVLMKGKGNKLFDPQGTTTIAEVATVVKTLADLSDAQKEAAKVTSTVRNLGSSDNVTRDFDVIQTAGVDLACGFGSWGMMARLNAGTINIYVARKHSDSQSLDAMAHPCVYARVTDPEGNVVARADMDYAEGTMEQIITIPNAQEGIYRVMFTGGSPGDVLTIGFQQPQSWGMILQDMMYFTSTQTQSDWYFWVPKKFHQASFGVGGSNAIVTIRSADGQARVAATAAATGTGNAQRKTVLVSGLTPETVYMAELPKNFKGTFGFQGLAPVICPTPEMAADLKGGYIDQTDKYGTFQFEGPLQAKARLRMVEIYDELNGDFSVDMTGMIPDEAPTEGLDNPRAEAALFGAYFGSIVGMKGAMEKQVTDPTNPWFGCFASYARQKGTEAFPTYDWQTRDYHSGGMRGTRSMVGALTINAETNYWYGNPVIQKRVELEWLAWVVQMNTGGCYTYANTAAGSGCSYYFRTYENFQFGEQGWPHGYFYSRNFLSPQTRAITDVGLRKMGEHIMTQRGQGVSNQMLMGVQGTLYTYLWTGDEFFHETFARYIDGVVYPSSRPGYLGQTSPQGYWQEGKGSDGASYGRMNEGMYDDILLHYLTLPADQQRPEVVKNLTDGINRFLFFDSQFYTADINGFKKRNSAAFTCRVNSPYGGNSAIIGNAYIQYMFPRAMANHDVSVANNEDPDTYNKGNAGTVASIIMSDAWAYRHLETYWPKYLGHYNNEKADSYTANDSWSMYKALHEKENCWFEYDEIPTVPVFQQGNYNIHDVPGGSFAAKHNGLYMWMMYSNDIDQVGGYGWHLPGPAQIWDEYFGTILSAQKPDNYSAISSSSKRGGAASDYRSAWTEPEIVHTSVIGKDGAGQLFVEGKGDGKFKWIEENKSWAIEYYDALSGRSSVWNYYMTEEGWDFEVGMADGVDVKEDLWVQLPLIDPAQDVAGSGLTFDLEACTATWTHEDKKVVLSWEKGTEARVRTKNGEDSVYRQLQIKLTNEKPLAKFSIRRDVGDYKLEVGIRDGQ